MAHTYEKIRKELDAAYKLQRKYADLPQAGWVIKGSRAKSNHIVLVPREEIKQLADDFYSALYTKHYLLYENLNLRHYLEQLATGEHDAVTCGKCHSVYRKGWLDGKCPYCEATEAAKSMLVGKETP